MVPCSPRPCPERLEDALATVGDQLGAGMQARLRTAPTVWCSWYHYFGDVTQDDVIENLDAIGSHDLPVTVVQVDDGWSAGIGDWLTLSGRFASLDQLAARIRDTGRRAGIWLAPFIAGAGSELARDHPDWLLGDAGYNWNEALYGLDLTHPGVQGYLRHVFEGLRDSGYDYFKLDFLYGGALPGERHAEQTAVQAYRSGLDVVRAAVGPDAYLVGCGAPMLPSIGRVDAMRVSSDTYDPSDADDGTDVLRGQASIEARAWQQGRLWVNDPDCLVARPGFAQRAAWADVIVRLGGLRSVSDRIRDLDARGLELTREVLSSRSAARPVHRPPGAHRRLRQAGGRNRHAPPRWQQCARGAGLVAFVRTRRGPPRAGSRGQDDTESIAAHALAATAVGIDPPAPDTLLGADRRLGRNHRARVARCAALGLLAKRSSPRRMIGHDLQPERALAQDRLSPALLQPAHPVRANGH